MKLNEPGLNFLKLPFPLKAVSVLSLLRTASMSMGEKREEYPVMEAKKGKSNGNEEAGDVKVKTLIGADLKIRSK